MNNNSIEFKKKYIKYKNKYIFLKDQLYFTHNTKLKQIGGEGEDICIPNANGNFDSRDQCEAYKIETPVEFNAAINLEEAALDVTAEACIDVLIDAFKAYRNVLGTLKGDEDPLEGESDAVIDAFKAYNAYDDASDASLTARLENAHAFAAYYEAHIRLTHMQKAKQTAIDKFDALQSSIISESKSNAAAVVKTVVEDLILAEEAFKTAKEAFKTAKEANILAYKVYIIAAKAKIIACEALVDKLMIVSKLGPKHAKALDDKLKTQM